MLDGEWPSALAIVRSLGRKGHPIQVGSSRTHPIAGLSRYCCHLFVYPDPLVNVTGFRKALLEQLHRCSYSLVIPVTDLTICPIMEIRESAEALSPLAMASNEALFVALSKSRTCGLARTLGIPIPKTLIIRDVEEFGGVQKELTYPVVIKADRSKTWLPDGQGLDITVSYALNLRELDDSVSRLLPLGPVVLQEYVHGEGVGIGVLAVRGDTIFAFQYRRLHEVPLTGGASSYRVSETIDPNLIDYASSLLKALCWDGMAMVEFKRDRKTAKSYLMEINGRFWGSLPLAVAAGADFPSYLFEMIVHQKHKFPINFTVGVRCRCLSREVEWLKAVLRRRDPNAIVQFPSYRSILLDCCRLLNPAEFSDTLDLRDPRPGIHELSRVVHRIGDDARNKYSYLREKHRMRRIQTNRKSLFERFRRAKTILIICSGNIIRSPFAAELLARLVKHKTTLSAGLEAVPGRQAHPSAVSKAKSLGFDISAHLSLPVTAEMVARADLIFVMEIRHLLLMYKRFSRIRRKTFLLACLDPEAPLEIPDPVSKNDTIFDLCLHQITKTLQAVTLIPSDAGSLHPRST